MHRAVLIVVLAAGCILSPGVSGDGPSSNDDTTSSGPPWADDDGHSMTGNASTGATSTGSTGAASSDDATFGAADESGGDFILTPDGGGICGEGLPPGTLAHCGECDPFDTDASWCGDGYKCTPWANDGGPHWNATRCSPIDPDPAQLGEPCTMMESEASGFDDCDLGLMCLYVDPATLEGTCVAMCQGSQLEPSCPDETTCAIDNDGVIVLCLPPCDPLTDDCELGTCIPVQDDFVCFADGTAAAPGEPCERPVDCTAGSTCLPEDTTGSCGEDTAACCTSYCDLNAPDPSAACRPGQTCAPWHRPGTVMPPLDAIGVCTLPG
jgi:hypothetical protein